MATQANLNFVQQLYVAYYGRPAESDGQRYWAERADAAGQGSIVEAFGNSKEYQNEFGNLESAELVNNLYQQLFGRDGDAEGVEYYAGLLDSGEKSLAHIALTIKNAAQGSDAKFFDARVAEAQRYTNENSDSYSTEAGRDAIANVSIPSDASLDFVQEMYVAYYGRPADAAGQRFWAEMADAQGQGAIVNAFGDSQEYQDKFSGMDNRELVNTLYQQLFDRDGDKGGLDYYAGVLDRGEKSLAEIALTIKNAASGSDAEFFDRRVEAAQKYTDGNTDNAGGGDTDGGDTGGGDTGGGDNSDDIAALEQRIEELDATLNNRAGLEESLEQARNALQSDEEATGDANSLQQALNNAQQAIEQRKILEQNITAEQADVNAAQDAVDSAFSETSITGENATPEEITAEREALKQAVIDSGGTIIDGVAQKQESDQSSSEAAAQAYNDFKLLEREFQDANNALTKAFNEGASQDVLDSLKADYDVAKADAIDAFTLTEYNPNNSSGFYAELTGELEALENQVEATGGDFDSVNGNQTAVPAEGGGGTSSGDVQTIDAYNEFAGLVGMLEKQQAELSAAQAELQTDVDADGSLEALDQALSIAQQNLKDRADLKDAVTQAEAKLNEDIEANGTTDKLEADLADAKQTLAELTDGEEGGQPFSLQGDNDSLTYDAFETAPASDDQSFELDSIENLADSVQANEPDTAALTTSDVGADIDVTGVAHGSFETIA
ncbi:DUF4214 domain-containing protein [Halomonas sp. M20]|uniref:DUF4214 domain-containing protein n=1 Tax=Halomonas sp. M20 TaxID=2763264 RepID=UPI001D0A02EB|nr:DUF4214 domain-containing protein [Halomonas sp. M20]